MQASKRSMLYLGVVNRNFIRQTTVNFSADRDTSENTEATQNVKSLKEIPGPTSLPIVGSLFNFLPGGKIGPLKGVELSNKMFVLYGPIVKLQLPMGLPTMIMLYDANAIELVHRSENAMPVRPGFASLEYYRKRHNKKYDPKRQTGLITDHGEPWKEVRSKVNQVLLQPKTIKLYTDVLEEVATDMVAKMKKLRDEKNMIMKKLDVEMNLWALESIGVVALGTRLNCFDPNLPADSPARKLIQNIHDFFEVAEILDFGGSPWRYFATPMFKKAMKVYEEQENLTKYFIDEATKKMNESTNDYKSDSEKPVLQKLLEINERVAHVMASDMLMAGVDTAANTALATFYLLAINPEKQQKLREEVLSKPPRRPYLRACLKESMRMLPIVNGNLRQASKDYTIMGYKIPKDTLLVFSHQSMSMMKEHYPNPEQFIPERWVAHKEDPLYHGNTHPFVTSPFGYGARMCIGRRIAELEMETFIAKVIENFELEWTGGPIQIKATSLNYITGPFNFVFKDL